MWNKFPQRGIYIPFRHLMVTLYPLFFLEYYEHPKYLSLEDNEAQEQEKMRNKQTKNLLSSHMKIAKKCRRIKKMY